MQGLRVRAAALALLVACGSAAAACGDDDNAPARPAGDGGVPVDADVPIIDATPPSADAGTFSVEDVADTPCATRGGSLREVFAADATKHRPLGMAPVGARRAMRTDDGVLLMDADGANASDLVPTSTLAVGEIGSTPNVLGAIGPDAINLSLARFDSSGAPSGGAITVAGRATGFGVGGGEGRLLVAWAADFELHAAAYGEQGDVLAPPFTFRSNTAEIDGALFAVAHAGGEEFGVAFTGEYGGTHRLAFTRVSTSKRSSTSYTLLLGMDPLRLVGMARVESKFALLFERKIAGATEILLTVLDAAGRFTGPTRRLVGVRRAFGVASSGGEIGVVVWRAAASGAEPGETSPDAIEFRSFDNAGAPLGDWVCLDEPFTTPTIDVGAAIAAEDNGYTVLMRTPKHAVSMARFDRRGTGQ
jgi:hypothetical protein